MLIHSWNALGAPDFMMPSGSGGSSSGGSSGSAGIGVYTMDADIQGLTSGKNYVIEGTFTDGVKAYEVTGTDQIMLKV